LTDNNNEEWPVISRYTAEEAERDGIFVHVGNVGSEKVYITANLFSEGYMDENRRIELVNRGLDLLRKPDPEDTDYM
jgi:hypothetical protein